jgi:CDP-diacylglycerol--glycerol-3-phosphate 3-phosphatidyltransferase
MNIANQITLSRIWLALICVWLIIQDSFASMLGAFMVFIVAALTDFLDGYFARKYQLVSDWGKLWDPIADKVLVIGVFLAFLAAGVVPLWVILAIILRELVITIMRMVCLRQGVVVEAKMVGKHKTVAQITAIVLIFIMLLLIKQGTYIQAEQWLKNFIVPFILGYVVIITLYSGALYVWDNRKLLRRVK